MLTGMMTIGGRSGTSAKMTMTPMPMPMLAMPMVQPMARAMAMTWVRGVKSRVRVPSP